MPQKKIKTLLLDDDHENEEREVCLMAIHCTLSIFRLAYFINGKIHTKLCREKDIDVCQEADFSFYPFYHYFDKEALFDYYLVPNKSWEHSGKKAMALSLFDGGNAYHSVLIPERPRVDFFLKIKGASRCKEDNLLHQLKTIESISTVYALDITTLDSYKNLIFD